MNYNILNDQRYDYTYNFYSWVLFIHLKIKLTFGIKQRLFRVE